MVVCLNFAIYTVSPASPPLPHPIRVQSDNEVDKVAPTTWDFTAAIVEVNLFTVCGMLVCILLTVFNDFSTSIWTTGTEAGLQSCH